MKLIQEFLSDFLSNEQEEGNVIVFGWFTYGGGQLGLSLTCGDGYSTATVEFPVEPEMWAFGANAQDARHEFTSFETSDARTVLREMDPSDFRRHAEDLDDLRREAVHTMSRAQRAFESHTPPTEPRAHASDREVVHRKRILCADGFSISVQASSYHYSEPRDNRFADIRLYELVECGYPEGPDGCEHEVPQWFEDFRECGDSKVFPYVPIMQVMKLIDAHGGRVEGGEIVTDY